MIRSQLKSGRLVLDTRLGASGLTHFLLKVLTSAGPSPVPRTHSIRSDGQDFRKRGYTIAFCLVLPSVCLCDSRDDV
jgi:hypothetical protein